MVTFAGENVIGTVKVVGKVVFQPISVVLWTSLGACEGTPCRFVDLGFYIIENMAANNVCLRTLTLQSIYHECHCT